MLARQHQLEPIMCVYLLELSACSVVTRVTVLGVNVEPLVDFFTPPNTPLPTTAFRTLLRHTVGTFILYV